MTQRLRHSLSGMALAIALTFAGAHQVTATRHCAATQTVRCDAAQGLGATPAPAASAKFARDAGRIEGVLEAQITRLRPMRSMSKGT